MTSAYTHVTKGTPVLNQGIPNYLRTRFNGKRHCFGFAARAFDWSKHTLDRALPLLWELGNTWILQKEASLDSIFSTAFYAATTPPQLASVSNRHFPPH